MTPEAELLNDLVAVLVVAGILAAVLILHFIVALDDLRKQVRELRRSIRRVPGIRP